jgi:hypothetical protein
MPQYLLTIQLPDNYDPSVQDEAIVRDMDLNEPMKAGEQRRRQNAAR